MIAHKKISKKAKAVLDLYRNLPEKYRDEVRKMILEQDITFQDSQSHEFTQLSDSSIKDIWETKENEHWDEYFDEKGYV